MQRNASLSLLFFLLIPVHALTQCFSSSGNPVGGSANMGTLDPKTISIIGFYKHANSSDYLEGSKACDFSMIDQANYNFIGANVSYGITHKLTLETEFGYFINKSQSYIVSGQDKLLRGYGFSNILPSLKYSLYHNYNINLEYAFSIGPSIPLAWNSQIVKGVKLPVDIQASTGALGFVLQNYVIKEHSFTGMRYFLYNRLSINGRNKDKYHYGNSCITSLFLSKHIIKKIFNVGWTGILQLRHEYVGRSHFDHTPVPSSGTHSLYVIPQINISPDDYYNLSFYLEIPVYQYVNEIQLKKKVSFGVNISRVFPCY